METDIIREFYRKIKLISKTDRKEIWIVKNTLDGQLCVAKLQLSLTAELQKKNNIRNILYEGKFLQTCQGYPGIPFLNWAGKDDSIGMSMVILEKLGMTVEKLFAQQGGKFTLKTVCQLGISIFDILQCYHDKGFVHGNLKLNCLQFGVGRKSKLLYLNDFIESLPYFKKGKHIKKQFTKSKIKVHQFLPFDRIQGYEASRKDDIESTILILIYLLKGSLPWSSLFQKLQFQQKNRDSYYYQKDSSINKEETNQQSLSFNKSLQKAEEKYKQILNKFTAKIYETKIQEICEGVCPQFSQILRQCRNMQYESKPNYYFYTRALKKIMTENDIQADGNYDWMEGDLSRLTIKRSTKISDMQIHLPFQEELLAEIYYPFQKKIELV